MKAFIIALLLGFFLQKTHAQEIGFIPEITAEVSQEDYNKGKYILENSYKAIEESGDWVYADYWNIAVGYSYMNFDRDQIIELLEKSKKEDVESFCAIIHHGKKEIKEGKFYQLLGDDFLELIADCKNIGVPSPRKSRLKAKSFYNGLNYDLIVQLDAMMQKDQKYRRDDDLLSNKLKWQKQKALDDENTQALKTIFENNGYPGKSVVGEEFKDYAALIYEHSGDLEFQEKYFPLIIKAMNKKELTKNMVRLIIDRLQLKKTGKQIFGTQVGVPMHEEKLIREIQMKYGL
ncbi:MAG: DUF6624 domain-containing protein [Bacteroidota bacterium]